MRLHKININLDAINRKLIKVTQEALGVNVDGIMGPKTKAALVKFQMDNNIVANGLIDRATLDLLGVLDSDAQGTQIIRTSNKLMIHEYYLPKDEYISEEEPILNDYLFLHHTAGWDNPFKQVDLWKADNRGKVGTEFIIGGQNIRNGENPYDGQVIHAFPTGGQAWHLGPTKSYYMNRHSVGIELCNFGYLNSLGETYVGVAADMNQIAKLDKPFRGYTQWHKYSDEQLYSLKKLILLIADRDNIDIHKGLVEWIKTKGVEKAFDYDLSAAKGEIKGLLTHTNVRQDKYDLFPQPELIDMLLSL